MYERTLHRNEIYFTDTVYDGEQAQHATYLARGFLHDDFCFRLFNVHLPSLRNPTSFFVFSQQRDPWMKARGGSDRRFLRIIQYQKNFGNENTKNDFKTTRFSLVVIDTGVRHWCHV